MTAPNATHVLCSIQAVQAAVYEEVLFDRVHEQQPAPAGDQEALARKEASDLGASIGAKYLAENQPPGDSRKAHRQFKRHVVQNANDIRENSVSDPEKVGFFLLALIAQALFSWWIGRVAERLWEKYKSQGPGLFAGMAQSPEVTRLTGLVHDVPDDGSEG